MTSRTKWIAALLTPLLLWSCGEKDKGPIQVSAIGGPPHIVNPNRDPIDAPSAFLMQSAAQGLVRFDAAGEIESALAQRWTVSDDGLRYTFRLARSEWPSGGRITADQVVARLRAAGSNASRNPAKPLLGAIEEIVAMTDEVLEITLKSPRLNFLQLLAQPEMAVIRNGEGSGPFRVTAGEAAGILRLTMPPADDEEQTASRLPSILLRGEGASRAVARFDDGKADLVVGGTIGDLPIARAADTGTRTLVFDPVAGLFGLAFTGADGPFADAEARQGLSMALDRPALVQALQVSGLQPRESLLPAGVEGLRQPAVPEWAATPLADRQATASRIVAGIGGGKPVKLRVALPAGPGLRLLFAYLRRDWAAIGVDAERVAIGAPADLIFVDEVAPNGLASWYLRHFTCERTPVCDPAADEMMAAARIAPSAVDRRTMLANADRMLAEQYPFIPIAAPVRWSLVAQRLKGFRPNVFGHHAAGELVAAGP